MTERMRDEQLDRRIRDFLAWQADELAATPTVSEMTARIGATAGRRLAWPRLAPQLRWALLAGLLIAGLVAAMIIGSGSRGGIVDAPEIRASNGWIAYSTRAHTATTGVEGQIYLVRDGVEPRLAVDALGAVCPAFSPDGRTLAYIHDASLMLADVDADGQVGTPRISVRGGVGHCPIWSPTGDAIALLGSGELTLNGLDGARTVLPLPIGGLVAFADTRMAWAPDGRTIAVGLDSGIWLLGVEGSPPVRLSNADALSLSWSPDGSRLVFYEEGNGATGNVSILGVAAGNSLTRVGPGSRPLWSPREELIAYRTDEGLGVLRPDIWEQLLIGNGYGFGGWSPDGRRLLRMIDTTGSAFGLHAVAADGSRETTLVVSIDTGSTRNFPNLGDLSWQAVYP